MKIVKLRTRKTYATAHNHVLVGELTEKTDIYVRLKCRSFHFRNTTLEAEHVTEGGLGDRTIPWSNIECINNLCDKFDWKNAKLVKGKDGIILSSNDEYATTVSRFKITHQ